MNDQFVASFFIVTQKSVHILTRESFCYSDVGAGCGLNNLVAAAQIDDRRDLNLLCFLNIYPLKNQFKCKIIAQELLKAPDGVT